jgi:5-(carboxyamino)imidazole ribonucleotide synthase
VEEQGKARTLGILGGGQLGRMTALAAARLGARCVVLDPGGRDTPAGQVAWRGVTGAFDDRCALRRFADMVDAATYEFENVPADSVAYLEKLVPVRPGARLLEVTQDRAAEKAFLNDAGVPTTPWRVVEGAGDIPPGPGVLKALRGGYDGRGQAMLAPDTDRAGALKTIGGAPALWEGRVDFAAECSVIVARDVHANVQTYGPARNTHAGGILVRSEVPARLDAATERAALTHARALAGALALVGVAAVEFFVLPDGGLLGNEVAPRPHNSGHWTIEACAASQFDAHARAALGLPLADASLRCAGVVMDNLLGPEGLARGREALAAGHPGAHLYGKAEARPGRKMGHITTVT